MMMMKEFGMFGVKKVERRRCIRAPTATACLMAAGGRPEEAASLFFGFCWSREKKWLAMGATERENQPTRTIDGAPTDGSPKLPTLRCRPSPGLGCSHLTIPRTVCTGTAAQQQATLGLERE